MRISTAEEINNTLIKLDLPHHEDGFCHGYAGMTVQAILCDEISTFMNRFQNGEPNEIDRLALLQGISIHQRPKGWNHLFSLAAIQGEQNLTITSQILQPKKLETKGGVHRVFSQTGIYSNDDIFFLLQTIRFYIERVNECPPFAITLSSHEHIVTLALQKEAFDNDRLKWQVFEPTLLPALLTLSNDSTLNLGVIFKRGSDVLIHMDWYCAKESKKIFTEIIQIMQTIPEWKKLHTVTPELAKKVEDKTGRNWLYFAVFNGDYTLAEKLIFAGAEVNNKNLDQTSSLEIAAAKGNIKLVELLLCHGANDKTALSAAIQADNVVIFEMCFQHLIRHKNLSEYIISEKYNNDQTFLHHAAYWGSTNCLNYFLSHGADVNAVDNAGQTALLLAAAFGQFNAAQILLNAGATSTINHKTKAGGNALVHASTNGHPRVVQLLVENGATINTLCFEAKSSPLYMSVQNNHLEVVAQLLKCGADINLGRCRKIPPLSVAAQNNADETVAFLISRGSTFICEDVEKSPLMIARKNNAIQAESILLRAGAGLCLCDDTGADTVTVLSKNPLAFKKVLTLPELTLFLKENASVAAQYHARFQARQHELKPGVFQCIEEAIRATESNYSSTSSAVFVSPRIQTPNTECFADSCCLIA